jgi:hypothetical protein
MKLIKCSITEGSIDQAAAAAQADCFARAKMLIIRSSNSIFISSRDGVMIIPITPSNN